MKARVEAGSTFADALGEHPKVFDELFVQLVRAGEIGGILDTILQRLGAYIEKNEKLKRRVKGAMVYPAIVLAVGGRRWSAILIALRGPDLREDVQGLRRRAPGARRSS